jgi:hypothetical protein
MFTIPSKARMIYLPDALHVQFLLCQIDANDLIHVHAPVRTCFTTETLRVGCSKNGIHFRLRLHLEHIRTTPAVGIKYKLSSRHGTFVSSLSSNCPVPEACLPYEALALHYNPLLFLSKKY